MGESSKPFQYKKAIIECSCKNNGSIITEYFGVSLAKLSLQITKNQLFNPTWIEQAKEGRLPPLNEKELLMASHLKLGHKLKVVSC